VPYSPTEYWSRLHERGDLSAAGQSGLPPEINRWLYAVLARNVRSTLGRYGLVRPAPAAVFDVGVGTGFWVAFWHALGARRVDGCDLVEAAIERVRAQAATSGRAGDFVVADISVEGSLPGRVYPLVSCCNVLLHVTEDDAFERAGRSIAALVAPGGHLMLVEPILLREAYQRTHDPAHASRARPLAQYRVPFETAGLELVAVAPATVLANNPIEASSAAALARYRRWWRFVVQRTKSRPENARWVGPIVSALDRVAMRTGAAPTSKIALFRRPG
jgi:2-polyprenyl-3-methyl-5-hydroxy-6-metoxy-1,4-benzoquinol methylase